MDTVTISPSAPKRARLKRAFGRYLGKMDTTDPENPVPRDATMNEIWKQVRGFLNRVVREQEEKAARDAATSSVTGLDL